jgi:uncharacterized Rmd1/YagE family protein
MERTWLFDAVAYYENFSLKELAPLFPGGRLTHVDLRAPWGGGEIFLYHFGGAAFLDVPEPERVRALAQIAAVFARHRRSLTKQRTLESFTVRDQAQRTRLENGVLQLDRLTPERAGVVALIVAQSAAMELYEAEVDDIFARTQALGEGLEKTGRVGRGTGPLTRFIGEAVSTRNEVLSVLHLLDKPDATWDDPEMDRIYGDLQAEFDLKDRYEALEHKLVAVQETLELVLDVERHHRMWLLELSIAALIFIELFVPFLKLGH